MGKTAIAYRHLSLTLPTPNIDHNDSISNHTTPSHQGVTHSGHHRGQRDGVAAAHHPVALSAARTELGREDGYGLRVGQDGHEHTHRPRGAGLSTRLRGQGHPGNAAQRHPAHPARHHSPHTARDGQRADATATQGRGQHRRTGAEAGGPEHGQHSTPGAGTRYGRTAHREGARDRLGAQRHDH